MSLQDMILGGIGNFDGSLFNNLSQQAGQGNFGMIPQFLQQGGATTGSGATTQGYLQPQMPQQPAPNPDAIPAVPVPQVQSQPLPPLPAQAGVDPTTTQPVQNPANGMMAMQFAALADKQKEQNKPETLGQLPPMVGNPYQGGGRTQTTRMQPSPARGGRSSNFAGLLGGYFA